MQLVETTGSFQLMGPTYLIRFEGYTVVPNDSFVSSEISRERVRLIASLHEDATDEEWLNYLKDSDGNLELAVASFLARFGPDQPELKLNPFSESKEEEKETDTKSKKLSSARS